MWNCIDIKSGVYLALLGVYSSLHGPSNILTFSTIKRQIAKMQLPLQDHTKAAFLSQKAFFLVTAKMLGDESLGCEAERALP